MHLLKQCSGTVLLAIDIVVCQLLPTLRRSRSHVYICTYSFMAHVNMQPETHLAHYILALFASNEALLFSCATWAQALNSAVCLGDLIPIVH